MAQANLPRLSCRERQPLHDSDSRKVASRLAHPLLGVQQLRQKLRSLLPDRVEDDVAEEREHVPDDLLVLVKLLHLLMEGGQALILRGRYRLIQGHPRASQAQTPIEPRLRGLPSL